MNTQQKESLITYLLTPFALAFSTLLFYLPSLQYKFQFDDINNIRKFFHIRHLGLKELFFSDTRWIGTWLNTLNYRWSEFDPFSYRLTNITIHIATGIGLFYVLLLAFSFLKKKQFVRIHAYTISLIASLFFLLHPVQTQTVSYIIQGRLEGLSALFMMLVLVSFLKFAQAKTRFVKVVSFISLAIFAAFGCCTKEIFIVTPLLIPLVDWFFVAQGKWSSFKKRIWVHAFLFGIVGSLFFYFKRNLIWKVLTLNTASNNNIGNTLTANSSIKIAPIPYLMSQFKVILHYFFVFLWPFGMSVEYDWKLVSGFFDPNCFFPFMMLMSVFSLIGYLLWKDRKNIYAFSLIWFFICIAPRSSLIPSAELAVDYKTYMASIGVFVLFALAIVKLSLFLAQRFTVLQQQYAVKKSFVGYMSLALLLGLLTFQRNTVWASGINFWGDIIVHAPSKARGYNNYGVELLKEGKPRQSLPYFKKAIKLEHAYWDAFSNLAIAYAWLDHYDLAVSATEQSLRINGNHVESYNNLGKYLTKLKEYDRAHTAFQVATQLRPYYGKAYFNWGNMHLLQNNIEAAHECFRKCCYEGDFDDNPHGFALYGRTCVMLEKYEDAMKAFNKSLQFDPLYHDALLGLGNVYHLTKRFELARQIFKKLAIAYPDDASGWCNMAQAYFSTRQAPEAIDCLMKARNCSNVPSAVDFTIAEYMVNIGEKTMARQLANNVINNPQAAEQLKQQAQGILQKLR